jgi:hypothetical protein
MKPIAPAGGRRAGCRGSGAERRFSARTKSCRRAARGSDLAAPISRQAGRCCQRGPPLRSEATPEPRVDARAFRTTCLTTWFRPRRCARGSSGLPAREVARRPPARAGIPPTLKPKIFVAHAQSEPADAHPRRPRPHAADLPPPRFAPRPLSSRRPSRPRRGSCTSGAPPWYGAARPDDPRAPLPSRIPSTRNGRADRTGPRPRRSAFPTLHKRANKRAPLSLSVSGLLPASTPPHRD